MVSGQAEMEDILRIPKDEHDVWLEFWQQAKESLFSMSIIRRKV